MLKTWATTLKGLIRSGPRIRIFRVNISEKGLQQFSDRQLTSSRMVILQVQLGQTVRLRRITWMWKKLRKYCLSKRIQIWRQSLKTIKRWRRLKRKKMMLSLMQARTKVIIWTNYKEETLSVIMVWNAKAPSWWVQQNLKNLIKEKQDHDEKLIWIFMIHRLMKKTMMQMMKVQERLNHKIRIHRKRKNKMSWLNLKTKAQDLSTKREEDEM